MSSFPPAPIVENFKYRAGYMPADEEGKQALRNALHRLDATIELFKQSVINHAPKAFEYYAPNKPAIPPVIQRTSRDLSACNLPEDIGMHLALVKQLYEALEGAATLYGTKDRRGYKQIIRVHYDNDFKGVVRGTYTEKYLDLGDAVNINGDVLTVKNVNVYDDDQTRYIECY